MSFIIGLDECGLGPWAGPLVVAAAVLKEDLVLRATLDSKKINESRRYALEKEVKVSAEYWVLARSSASMIDRHGLASCLEACMLACAQRARAHFPDARLIVDGVRKVPGILNQETMVKADDKVQAVGAASIIAKVHRDQYMVTISATWPQYLFHRHKGYGTRVHREALNRYGVCPEHRKSYEPVRRVLNVERQKT